MTQIKEKDDIVLLKYAIRFYGYIGTFPYIKKYKLIVLLPFYLVILTCFAKSYLESQEELYSSYVGLVIHISFICFLICFSLVSLKDSYRKEKLWNQFFKNVEVFDFFMNRQDITLKVNVYKYYCKFVFCNLLYLAFVLFRYSQKFKIWHVQQIIGVIYILLLCNQMYITTLFLEKLFKVLEKRYDFLKRKLGEVYGTGSRINLFWNNQQLKRLHLLLYTTGEKTNEIFGKHVLLIIVITFLFLIACFQHVLLEKSQKKFAEISDFTAVIQMIIFLVSLKYFKYRTNPPLYICCTINYFFQIWFNLLQERISYTKYT